MGVMRELRAAARSMLVGCVKRASFLDSTSVGKRFLGYERRDCTTAWDGLRLINKVGYGDDNRRREQIVRVGRSRFHPSGHRRRLRFGEALRGFQRGGVNFHQPVDLSQL